MTVSYEVLPGGDKLMAKLERIQERSNDFAPAFAKVSESFRAIETDRFANNGYGWLPLAQSTLSMTGSWARVGNPDETLQNTGALLASLQGGAGWFEQVTPYSVAMGTTVPYAHWHQTGGTRTHASGAGWPPQRKIVELSEKDVLEWGVIVRDWLFGGL